MLWVSRERSVEGSMNAHFLRARMASLRLRCAAEPTAVLLLPNDAAALGSVLTGRPPAATGTMWLRSLWSTAVCMGPVQEHTGPVSAASTHAPKVCDAPTAVHVQRPQCPRHAQAA